MLYLIFIIFFVLLICQGVFGYIFGLKHTLPVKTIQISTFKVYLHKLKLASIEFFISKQQQCPCHRKELVAEAFVCESVISEMLKVFVNKLDKIKAG